MLFLKRKKPETGDGVDLVRSRATFGNHNWNVVLTINYQASSLEGVNANTNHNLVNKSLKCSILEKGNMQKFWLQITVILHI